MKTKIEKVTNDTYLKVFQNNLFKTSVMPDSQSVMKNEISLELNKDENYFKSGIEIFENLGQKNSDRYQYVFPYYEFSKNLINDEKKGSLIFNSNGSNNLINTNNLTSKITNNLNYVSPSLLLILALKIKWIVWKNFNIISKNNTLTKIVLR